ncbi:MAG: ester cyclase [bacterium]
MARPAENLTAARDWIQAMVDHDPGRMGAMAAEDVHVLEVAEGEVHEGRDYLIWAYEDLFSAYPDCTCEIINDFAGDDQVMVEVRWRGTETGSFRGHPPTGGKVDIRIGYIFRFAGGLISAITEYYDASTLERQLAGA